jgi:hypothetical protein
MENLSMKTYMNDQTFADKHVSYLGLGILMLLLSIYFIRCVSKHFFISIILCNDTTLCDISKRIILSIDHTT